MEVARLTARASITHCGKCDSEVHVEESFEEKFGHNFQILLANFRAGNP